MAGRLNSWVCSPWSLFAALPVRGSIPRSWAARHLLGLTESHCCPVVTVHMNRQWVWVESSQGLENRFDPSHPIHKCVSTVQCSMVVKALNLALTTVKTVKRQSLTAWLYTCRWIACFLTLHDSMDRRSQMFTIGWLFVWVTGIIPAVNNSLIGRGFRIFRGYWTIMYWPSQIWGTGPIPSSKKSPPEGSTRHGSCCFAKVKLWKFVTVNFNFQSCWGKIYPLLLQVDEKNIYLQDPLIKEYQWQHFCKVSVFGWKRWTRTVETWWTIWTRTRFWVSLSCSVVVRQVGWKASDLDLIEANEAFAAQALAVNKVGLAGEGRFEGVHL